ncbi:Putative uncharacterized protein [Moritella viscosa]|nr:Putative uncharacterized protein [Moritella viscosa]SHO23622.1 Putative uncharacterized protein [Moritella viscosa]
MHHDISTNSNGFCRLFTLMKPGRKKWHLGANEKYPNVQHGKPIQFTLAAKTG